MFFSPDLQEEVPNDNAALMSAMDRMSLNRISASLQ
jgi:hypothetical protein